jgi:hypothetical protein
MKFCHDVPEICHGQVHGPRKERKRIIIVIIIIIILKKIKIIIIIRNGAKTLSLQTLFGRLNYHTITAMKALKLN